ncbi:unnamed protein product, partial [Ectocarpus sp. 8 AP-2014]
MTTPEVLRSTSLRSRSAVRNATSTPQHQAGGTGGGAAATHVTPARGTPSERRLFSPEDSNRWGGQGGGGGGSAARLTPSEVAKAGRRAIAVRPQDVGDLMKVYDERHAKPAPADPASQTNNGGYATGQGLGPGGFGAALGTGGAQALALGGGAIQGRGVGVGGYYGNTLQGG